jgi:hypothetical protein
VVAIPMNERCEFTIGFIALPRRSSWTSSANKE